MAFPSPAENYQDASLDLNGLLVQNPSATFFVRNESRDIEHILPGDILVVDRSLGYRSGSIVIAIIDDDFVLGRLIEENNRWKLVSDLEENLDIDLAGQVNWEIWGIVRHYIHSF